MSDFLPEGPINWQGQVGVVSYGSDDKLVIFYNKLVLNPQKSTELGREYKDPKIFVKIQTPGERDCIDRPATVSDQRRWPIQWAQFQQNTDQLSSGTPIELLHPNNPAIAANLRAAGVQTIEQAANLSGPAIDNIGMGAQQYSNDAKKYLEAASKGVHFTQMQHELEQRDSEIRVLKQQLDDLKVAVARQDPANQGNYAQGINAQAMTPAMVAQMLASMMQNPVYPPPGVQPTKAFDVQAAQIAAVHASHDEALARTAAAPKKRGRPRKGA